ncbi:MAG: hypothetical protein HKM93_23605 [Desulfobacteraceae bacterium]|nr:hypothetical protein [Desulfobacteraceae bacterium]
MPYIRAEECLPLELIGEIQKYIHGTQIYIPKKQKRSGWGEKNGTREKLDHRNASIRSLKTSGLTIAELADRFHLSTDSIRKIVYY